MPNRKTRRAARSFAKRTLKRAVYDDFKDNTLNYYKRNTIYCKKSKLLKSFINSIYSVRVYPFDEKFKKVAIIRFDEKEINDWDTIQKIKNDIFGKESWAVEVYPKESELQDVANIRWIFVSEGEQFIGLNK